MSTHVVYLSNSPLRTYVFRWISCQCSSLSRCRFHPTVTSVCAGSQFSDNSCQFEKIIITLVSIPHGVRRRQFEFSRISVSYWPAKLALRLHRFHRFTDSQISLFIRWLSHRIIMVSSWPENSVCYHNWLVTGRVEELQWPMNALGYWQWLDANADICVICLVRQIPVRVPLTILQRHNLKVWMSICARCGGSL